MLWGMDEGTDEFAGLVDSLTRIGFIGAVAVGVIAMLAVTVSFLAYTKRVRLANEVEHPSTVPEPEYVPLGDESDWQAFVDLPVEGDEDREI